MENCHPVVLALIGTSIIFGGSVLGTAFVFFAKNKPCGGLHKLFLGFAAGVMMAASVWSLLLPSMEMAERQGLPGWLPAAVGFVLGGTCLFLLDRLLFGQSCAPCPEQGDAPCKQKTAKLVFALTLHNVPEGMAVGLAFAMVAVTGSGVTFAAALALALGVALQNVPEGAVVSLPLRGEGMSKGKAFAVGTLSGAVEPVAGMLGALVTAVATVLMPWLLSFAAGAMLYVVVDELVPAGRSNSGTAGAMLGFVLMMILDITLG